MRETTEEEEDDEEGEEAGLLDCGLRLKKVSFAERGLGGARPGPSQEALLEEGSPTMVEKGLEPRVHTWPRRTHEGAGGGSQQPPTGSLPAVLLRRAGGEAETRVGWGPGSRAGLRRLSPASGGRTGHLGSTHPGGTPASAHSRRSSRAA